MRLREIPRCAAFAWSPGSGLPLVVTGTRAGAVDADFSDETKLELWDLSLDDLEQGVELQPIASISTDSRFHDIAWGPANAEHPRGIIAGALENGSLDLWDAEKLIKGGDDAFMSRTTKHSGAIKSLQFNPLKPQILATAGTKGELFIYDINDISNPFRLGTPRPEQMILSVWHGIGRSLIFWQLGEAVVWDLKTKKASLTLNNNRKAVGAIAWDPNNATKLLTATPDDSSPVILLWDLRNSNAPERTLAGHDQGILSLSWCQLDSDLLLSCGKDNRTLVWNPQTGERLGEFPEVTNWTFQTRFNPHNPALSATASFDGKISIQTLQNTNSTSTQTPVQGPVDGEDFFTKAQTQPQGASFSLKKAPKWLERPAGASFGFGGKLVSFGLLPIIAGQHRSSKIQISNFSVDSDIGSATETFEKALASGNIGSICESHISEAKSEQEKADWKVIETLISDNPRKKVTEYLGFSDEVEEAAIGVAGLDLEEKTDETAEGSNGTAVKNSRLSTLFSDGVDGDDFLSTIAATKGAKTDNPFHLFSEADSASEKQITKALMLGQFEKAMTICLKEDKIADALIIANCGGKELLEKAQSVYLSKKSTGPNYLRLLSSVIGKNLWDIVYNADLSNWKETMATLCTYADPSEFPDLCEALGDRIIEIGAPKDASFCYLVGSKLEKVITIWIAELQDAEKAGIEDLSEDSSFSVHARVLQNFIEKVTVFRDVTKFQDNEQGLTSDWKLAPLYDKYNEYADIVAAHGHLSIAERYLDLLPTQYPAAEVARSRVKLASRKAAPRAAQQQQPASVRNTSRPQPGIGYQPPAATPARPAQNTFAPPAPNPVSNPYAPPSNAYAPQQPYQQPQQGQQGYGQTYGSNFGSVPPPNNYGAPPQSFGGPPTGPPRNTTPSAPPPPKVKDMTNWNDTPMVSKPPRRATPSTTPAPFANQQNFSMPPPANPYGVRATATPPPPPPKGPAHPRVSSPLTSGPPHPFQPRPSSAANHYAPAPTASSPAQHYGLPPTIPRGASPYNAPPAGPPPSNRYAPSPAAQQYSQPPTPQSQVAPPPQAGNRPPPPANPYAPGVPPLHTPQSQFSQPYDQNQPPAQFQNQGPPPASQGPPPSSRPPTGPPPKSATPTAPVKPKHPSGDRSHIPAPAQRMVDIFSGDMQRVASKAPPSFAAQVKDTQKRLNILFDHLNNEELVKPETITRLSELAEALNAKNYDVAARLQVDIQREKTDECGNWMVGVKRLVSMSKVTP
ncbi:Protein transport protein [Lachnellula occidentalis]|uniref:Protein transport protein SEC31 n=1 Tax=Lachnellula occidentalis TaxID=215460 RepID=A0A8H8S9N6_9HELO|nr:Protein transport protein [Lachnellula occidentalis]